MSPILVRPVREQLEHDRVIRLLQTRSRRKYEAGINPGAERNVAFGAGSSAVYPDLILQSTEKGRRVLAVVEVETGESVNHLEALAQWANFAKLRTDFHLYVPSGMIDVARRLCEENRIIVTEIWSYHTIADDVRFTLVHRGRESNATAQAQRAKPRPTPSKRPKPSRAAKPTVRAKPAKKAKRK